MRLQNFTSPSARVYAVCLGQMRTEIFKRDNGSEYGYYNLPAVWYKKKGSNIHAGYGEIWSYLNEARLSAEEFVTCNDKNDIPNATMLARYDGKNFWGIENLERQKEIIELLKPMLIKIPTIPDGYKGWFSLK